MIVKDPQTQALELHVYDWEQVGKHDKMGMNVVPLKELTPDEPKVMTLDLFRSMDLNDARNEKTRGQIVVELTYKPFKKNEIPQSFDESKTLQKAPDTTPAGGGVLVVIVHEAQDVEGKHHTNPYVTVLLRGEKKKTKETLGHIDINLSDVLNNKKNQREVPSDRLEEWTDADRVAMED